MMTKETIRMKELLSLGFKKTHISTILKEADVFEGMPKQQGYAVEYSFNQACYMVIGCLLLELGLSTRHVNIALVTMWTNFYAEEDLGFGSEKARQRIIKDKISLAIRRCDYVALDRGKPSKGLTFPVISIVTGLANSTKIAHKDVRVADITSRFEPENYRDIVFKADDGQERKARKDPAGIIIDLRWVIEEVAKLFS